MTLQEWVEQLHPKHGARRELAVLLMGLDELKKLRDDVKQYEIRIAQFREVQRRDAEVIKDAEARWLAQVEETRRIDAMNRSIP